MNNINRAAKIIDSLHTADQILMEGSVGYFDAPAAAQELADAGILAPDLPRGTGDPEDILEWRPISRLPKAVIWAGDQNRPIMIQNVEPGDLTPEEAEALGLALLAAAQHARGKHD